MTVSLKFALESAAKGETDPIRPFLNALPDADDVVLAETYRDLASHASLIGRNHHKFAPLLGIVYQFDWSANDVRVVVASSSRSISSLFLTRRNSSPSKRFKSCCSVSLR